MQPPSLHQVVYQLLYVLPPHLCTLAQGKTLHVQFATVGKAEVLGHLDETNYEFLHPAEGLLVLYQLVCHLQHLQLQFFHLFLQEGDLQCGITFWLNPAFRFHLWGVKTGDHAFWADKGILLYSSNRGCFLCEHGLDLNLRACLQLIPEIPYGFVLVEVVVLELVDLFLQHNDDAFLRLDWLAMALHSCFLLFTGSLILVVFMVMRM